MTEPAPARPRFTRRRVLLGAMALVLGLAVAGFVFRVFGGGSAGKVKAQFVQFDRSNDGKTILATLRLTNSSDKLHNVFSLFWPDSDWCQFNSNRTQRPNRPHKFVRVTSMKSRDITYLTATDGSNDTIRSLRLLPRSAVTTKVELPQDGRVCYLSVRCLTRPKPIKQLPGWLAAVRRQWWHLFPPDNGTVWAVCEERIQCPQIRSDGTVEPPQVLPPER